MNTDRFGELIASIYMQMLQEYRDKQKAALETAHLINIWIGEEGETPKDTKSP
ncbi:MAG: hypothetical protein VX278_11915 [Myxococcota bacterium]|nr:hypothetical protein [Myxococcota bacterium]